MTLVLSTMTDAFHFPPPSSLLLVRRNAEVMALYGGAVHDGSERSRVVLSFIQVGGASEGQGRVRICCTLTRWGDVLSSRSGSKRCTLMSFQRPMTTTTQCAFKGFSLLSFNRARVAPAPPGPTKVSLAPALHRRSDGDTKNTRGCAWQIRVSTLFKCRLSKKSSLELPTLNICKIAFRNDRRINFCLFPPILYI